MKARALALVDAWAPEEDHSIFISYKDRQYSDDYFMKSAGNISFFLEEDAQDPDGRLLYPKHESINKIAHALHDRDEVFREYSYSDTIKELLRGVGFIKPMIVQSMYIMKPTRIGGVVYPH
jgi:phytanoyl-CoA hydroxylase